LSKSPRAAKVTPVSGAERVAAIGEVLWDVFPDGRRLGGAPANVACHLARLGRPVALVSRVGDDDLGRAAVAGLAERGVDTAAVQVDPERPTGVVRVELEGGEPRYAIEPAAWDALACPPAVEALAGGAGLVCFGSLAQRDPLARSAIAQAVAATPPGAWRLLDLNLRPPHDEPERILAALELADAVKLNADELARVGGLLGGDPLDRLLGERGLRLVAVTRGAAGALLATPDERVEAAGTPAAPGGDAVGAGDAFCAVLAHHLLRRTPLARAGELANRYGAFVASRRGAVPDVPADLLAEVRG